jgi:hypothetical protein
VKSYESGKTRILEALDQASSCCPIQYIEQYANVVSPLLLLEELEAEGITTRFEKSDWSPSGYPLFKLASVSKDTTRTRK